MAPVRRYLRISKYSVLECRIYVDNPAHVHTWLLNPRNPILPRVIESIRPLVLPKLREERERERAKKKSSKKKNIKDVVVQDDFEVSMFLTESSTRHSLLTKHKDFQDKGATMMESNSSKLLSGNGAEPIDVDAVPIRREDDSDDEGFRLADIPSVDASRASKRRRSQANAAAELGSSSDEEDQNPIEIDSDEEPPPGKRRRAVNPQSEDENDNDKKKMAMVVSYEGFTIHGKVLCLVVKKRNERVVNTGSTAPRGGQARMENWISSTQILPEELAES